MKRLYTGRAQVATLLTVLLLVAACLALNAALPLAELEPRRIWTGLLYGIVAVAVLGIMLARSTPPWMYLPLLLFFVIPQFNPNFYTLFHSFLHISIVYESFLRGLPPENPLMAGEPLRYMYGVHAAIAWLMRLVPVSPPVAFAALDALTLVAFSAVMNQIARRLSPDVAFRVLAVVLALFGMDIFVDGPLYVLVGEVFGQRRFGAPSSLMKFTGINTNQVGLLCMAVAVLAMVRLAAREQQRLASYAMFAAATLAAAVFYQPAWIAIGAAAGSLAAAVVVLRLSDWRRDAWTLLALLAFCTAIAAPVLFNVSTGTPEDPAVQILPGLHQLRVNGEYWVLHILAPLLLLVFARRQAMQVAGRVPAVCAVLAVTVVVLHAIYLLVYVRFNNEYKFLGFASVALAPLGAVVLQTVYQSHRRVFLFLLLLFVVPCMTDFTYVTLPQPLTDHIVGEGRRVRHLQADEDALYSWIWEQTDRSAVFVDSLLTVPALAGRQLFVGLDIGRDPEVSEGRMHNGWLIDANVFLERIISVDPAKLALRRRIATDLLNSSGPASTELMAALRAASPAGRPLYVITRNETQRQRLNSTPGTSVVFERAGRVVFRINA
jgi:hypothetical protein